MNKYILSFIVIVAVLIAGYFYRYTYKTAYLCIYKIDNLTNKTYLSCQGEDWTLIKDKPTAKEYLND